MPLSTSLLLTNILSTYLSVPLTLAFPVIPILATSLSSPLNPLNPSTNILPHHPPLHRLDDSRGNRLRVYKRGLCFS